MLPAELFIKDVNILHEFLEERKIETWMWGDMLLSPGEFPGHDSTNFHGNREGYGKELRAEIPRSVIICDWHYKSVGEEFPSTTAFIEEGFRVIRRRWEGLSDLLDQAVRVDLNPGTREGVVVGLDEDGALRLQLENGQVERILAGDVAPINK